jgi:hypothetical protein
MDKVHPCLPLGQAGDEEDKDKDFVRIMEMDSGTRMVLLISRGLHHSCKLGAGLMSRRRLERENNPLSIWPPSPKSPYRDEE